MSIQLQIKTQSPSSIMNRNIFICRVARKLARYFFSILNVFYFFAYVLPWLKFNNFIKGAFNLSFGYQSILVSSKYLFIKVAISKRATIEREYINYSRIKTDYPCLALILPNYQLVCGCLVTALVCERMAKVGAREALPLAMLVQKRLNESILIGQLLKLNDCTQIKEGLRCISGDFGLGVAGLMKASVENFLLNSRYTIGFVHGDFHSRNIMKDRFGNPKIIDLDCIRFNGIREFDALYFALEQVWSFSGEGWIESLSNCFGGAGGDVVICLESFGVKWSNGLGIAFFLDRLGQDAINYKVSYPRDKLKRFVNAALKIE